MNFKRTTLRRVASYRNSNVDKKSHDGETPVRLCNYTDVYYNDRIDGAMDFMQATATPEEVAEFTLRKGDVLITKDSETPDDIGIPSLVARDLPGVLCGYHLTRIRAGPKIEPAFLFYALASCISRSHFEVEASGVTRHSLGQNAIATLLVRLLPVDEQRAIATYLDRETARIDALVAAKKRQIGLLQEREDAERRWLIAGEPAPETRRGGADWIGDIPDHWEIMALKRACRLESGHTPRRSVPEYWDGGDIPWVSLADSPTLRRQDFIETTKDCTTQAGIDGSSAHVLPEGTVAFSRDATVGLCAILAIPMAVSQHFIGWVPTGKMHPEFTLAVVKAMNQKLESLRSGSTIPTIGMPHIEALQTPVPSTQEQEDIVKRLRVIRTQMGQARSTLKRSINGLRERRQALITHAVTGNLKVPIEVIA